MPENMILIKIMGNDITVTRAGDGEMALPSCTGTRHTKLNQDNASRNFGRGLTPIKMQIEDKRMYECDTVKDFHI